MPNGSWYTRAIHRQVRELLPLVLEIQTLDECVNEGKRRRRGKKGRGKSITVKSKKRPGKKIKKRHKQNKEVRKKKKSVESYLVVVWCLGHIFFFFSVLPVCYTCFLQCIIFSCFSLFCGFSFLCFLTFSFYPRLPSHFCIFPPSLFSISFVLSSNL